jgi:hypothetical protein
MRRLSTVAAQGISKHSVSSFLLRVLPSNHRFSEWAMLGSNQRPLPREGRAIISWSFADVQKIPAKQQILSYVPSPV